MRSQNYQTLIKKRIHRSRPWLLLLDVWTSSFVLCWPVIIFHKLVQVDLKIKNKKKGKFVLHVPSLNRSQYAVELLSRYKRTTLNTKKRRKNKAYFSCGTRLWYIRGLRIWKYFFQNSAQLLSTVFFNSQISSKFFSPLLGLQVLEIF